MSSFETLSPEEVEQIKLELGGALMRAAIAEARWKHLVTERNRLVRALRDRDRKDAERRERAREENGPTSLSRGL